MEFGQYTSIIGIGFLVWLAVALGTSVQRHYERFFAYMAALMFCLIGTSEIMIVKPVAFFFTIGGVLAFCYVLARSLIVIRIRK